MFPKSCDYNSSNDNKPHLIKNKTIPKKPGSDAAKRLFYMNKPNKSKPSVLAIKELTHSNDIHNVPKKKYPITRLAR